MEINTKIKEMEVSLIPLKISLEITTTIIKTYFDALNNRINKYPMP